MRRRSHGRDQRGFTLIELLIVAALLGVVMAAVLGLVQTTQRHVHTAEEVVEVQQNLRVALERMSRDLRLAGFLVDDGPAIVAAAADALTLRTATVSGAAARIAAEFSSPASPNTPIDVQVASVETARLFENGDLVRIVRPGNRIQPLDRVLRVVRAPGDITTPVVPLQGFNAAVDYRPGDTLVKVFDVNLAPNVDPNTSPPVHPNILTYALVDDPDSADAAQQLLQRSATGLGDEILAVKVTDLAFAYLLDDGSELAALPAGDPRLDNIRAVRITLTGATDATQTGIAGYLAPGQDSNVKTRSLTTVVQLRNR